RKLPWHALLTASRHSAEPHLEIIVDDVAVIATGQPFQGLHIAGFAEEAGRAIAKHEKRPAGVAAAKSLRSGPVDPCAVVIHRPHHVADPNAAVAQPTHPRPNG